VNAFSMIPSFFQTYLEEAKSQPGVPESFWLDENGTDEVISKTAKCNEMDSVQISSGQHRTVVEITSK
jgi:hypothetical protein